jgi:hypothetical protein
VLGREVTVGAGVKSKKKAKDCETLLTEKKVSAPDKPYFNNGLPDAALEAIDKEIMESMLKAGPLGPTTVIATAPTSPKVYKAIIEIDPNLMGESKYGSAEEVVEEVCGVKGVKPGSKEWDILVMTFGAEMVAKTKKTKVVYKDSLAQVKKAAEEEARAKIYAQSKSTAPIKFEYVNDYSGLGMSWKLIATQVVKPTSTITFSTPAKPKSKPVNFGTAYDDFKHFAVPLVGAKWPVLPPLTGPMSALTEAAVQKAKEDEALQNKLFDEMFLASASKPAPGFAIDKQGNLPIVSASADIKSKFEKWLGKVHEKISHPDYGVPALAPVAMVHDEYLYEAPAEYADAATLTLLDQHGKPLATLPPEDKGKGTYSFDVTASTSCNAPISDTDLKETFAHWKDSIMKAMGVSKADLDKAYAAPINPHPVIKAIDIKTSPISWQKKVEPGTWKDPVAKPEQTLKGLAENWWSDAYAASSDKDMIFSLMYGKSWGKSAMTLEAVKKVIQSGGTVSFLTPEITPEYVKKKIEKALAETPKAKPPRGD